MQQVERWVSPAKEGFNHDMSCDHPRWWWFCIANGALFVVGANGVADALLCLSSERNISPTADELTGPFLNDHDCETAGFYRFGELSGDFELLEEFGMPTRPNVADCCPFCGAPIKAPFECSCKAASTIPSC
jgi:hypothetical protein